MIEAPPPIWLPSPPAIVQWLPRVELGLRRVDGELAEDRLLWSRDVRDATPAELRSWLPREFRDVPDWAIEGMIPGPIGLFFGRSKTFTLIISGSSTTVQGDWNSADNRIDCIGAGGDGASGFANFGDPYGGGGGGGAAWARKANLTLTPSASVSYQVGTTGDTWYSASGTVLAKAGSNASAQTQGAGGSSGSSVGDSKSAGGNGGNGYSPGGAGNRGGGGGGGAGGPNGAGAAGSTATSGTGGAGGTADNGQGGAGASPSGNNGGVGTSGSSGGFNPSGATNAGPGGGGSGGVGSTPTSGGDGGAYGGGSAGGGGNASSGANGGTQGRGCIFLTNNVSL